MKEKQIEEMANIIYDNTESDTMWDEIYASSNSLYNAGYRKQINAEWKSGNKNGQYGYYCTNCDACFTGENAEWIAKSHDFCPKCGAKMKGGAE